MPILLVCGTSVSLDFVERYLVLLSSVESLFSCNVLL